MRIGHSARYRFAGLLVCFLGIVALGCGASEEGSAGESDVVSNPGEYRLRVVNTFPHSRDAFTQGLVYHEGYLYEGTGQRGASSLRKIKLETGETVKKHELGARYFGEGVTIVDDRILQLTWHSQTGFVYDLETFEKIDQFQYLTQGWGLTYDGSSLIMSDGTSTLQLLNPDTYEYTGFISVRDNGVSIRGLNELEYIDGEIFANVWPTDRLVRIDPESGRVTAWIHATGLMDPADYADSSDVLNGIAWDAKNERLFLTGKYWPKLFEVELVPFEE